MATSVGMVSGDYRKVAITIQCAGEGMRGNCRGRARCVGFVVVGIKTDR
jgi:hypothetical protein